MPKLWPPELLLPVPVTERVPLPVVCMPLGVATQMP